MKSRFLLPSNPTAARDLSPRDLSSGDGILVQPVKARVTVSAARRFELQHNTSPKWARRRQGRRHGQALLLAVLIMLLAALLGAGFLAVVSGNLNQSARIADKTRAIEASRAGITYANAQLSTSADGDRWRPVDVSPVPDPSTQSARYEVYYSQLDKVQGWAAKPTPKSGDMFPNADYPVADYPAAVEYYKNQTYSKFPAPDQAIGDAPKFLVKVEEIPLNPNAANYDEDHAGEIKITSIGLSDDDPNVFHRAVAYKAGRRKSPFASALRSISNWNFKANNGEGGVPSSTIVVSPSTNSPYSAGVAPTLPATTVGVNVDPTDASTFSQDNVPFNVVIVRKDTNVPANSSVRGAVVTAVTPPITAGEPAVLTLAKLEAPNISAGETIQKAAAIGTAPTIDLLNTGAPIPPAFPSPPTGQSNQPNGILANGSIWLQNQVVLSDLSRTGTKLYASGSLAIDDNGTNAKKLVISTTANSQIGPADTGNPNSNKVVPSSQSNFPGDIVLTAAAASDGVEKTDLINDGWNKINAKFLDLDYSADKRDVKPFTPAKIDSAKNLARYRALTRNSANGIYIDNREDVEKVGTTAMTQKQLLDMLNSPTAFPKTNPSNHTRTSEASDLTDATKSLEQKHLRGWVGPDEFLARGALVEFIQPNGIPRIRLTYDARSDANPNGPERTKTFRDANGDFRAGVYTQTLQWPKNGTLFAEGNVRIRGDINLSNLPTGLDPNDFPSLTVVSLNNIYIEGALSVDSKDTNGFDIPVSDRKKLMLLAKKNVIVNPTRAVIARTDVQTVANNTAPVTLSGTLAVAAPFSIGVTNVEAFNTGDYAEVTGATISTPIRGIITNIDSANSQLTISSTATGVIPASTSATPIIVRSPLENRSAVTASPNTYFSLVDTEKALNRRIVAPFADNTTAGNNKLDFDHVADLKQGAGGTVGLEIKAEDLSTLFQRPTTPTFVAELTNKQPLTTDTQNLIIDRESLASTDKLLRTYNNFTADNRQDLPNPRTAQPLSGLLTQVNNVSQQRTMPNEGYKYTASLVQPDPVVDPGTGLPIPVNIGSLPYHALAGMGLRYAPATVFTTPANTAANNKRVNFNDPAEVTIPLATSVEFDLNGVATTIKPSAAALTTRYFGFPPAFGDSEDAVTVDSTFYQTDLKLSTVDPRIVDYTSSSVGPYGYSIVLRRPAAPNLAAATAFSALPDYRLKGLKYEFVDLTRTQTKPVANPMQINAFVYAQEGSWLVIPGSYFRSDSPVRAIVDGSGNYIGSYIDYANPTIVPQPDTNEYIVDGSGRRVADINRNGKADNGEYEAALRFVRENEARISFLGAIVENQTAVVADVGLPNQTPVVKGAVQDWTDKWATYNDTSIGNNLGEVPNATGDTRNFSFVKYVYDPAIQSGSLGANQLRVPVTDDLIYQQ